MTSSHSSKLAEQLTALMAYRNRPQEKPEPLQSNWTVIPANDNADPEEIADFSFERNLLVTPSVQEIMRQVKLGPVDRNDVGQIVGIGRLQFSDGTQTEKGFMRGPDGDTIKYDRRMEAGAMLRTVEKPHDQAGGKGYTDVDMENSNTFFAATFKTEKPRYIKRSKRRNGPSLSAQQSREMIDAAIANTPVMPAVTYCPTALPCGSERVSDSFVGFTVAGRGQSGSIAWQDVAQTIENVKVWKQVKKALKSKDLKVIDAAMTAQSFEEVGVAAGLAGEYARRKGGKLALLAANDNLAAAIKKFAA